jgi:hypothetical protein
MSKPYVGKPEAVSNSDDSSVNFYESMQLNIPEDIHLQGSSRSHCCYHASWTIVTCIETREFVLTFNAQDLMMQAVNTSKMWISYEPTQWNIPEDCHLQLPLFVTNLFLQIKLNQVFELFLMFTVAQSAWKTYLWPENGFCIMTVNISTHHIEWRDFYGRAITPVVSCWTLSAGAKVSPLGFVLDKVTVGQVFLRVRQFSLSI